MVYVLLADGFEEAEVIVPLDLLRRGGVEVQLVGINGSSCTSSHAVTMTTDARLEEVTLTAEDMVFVPGGLGGVDGILASDAACSLLRHATELGCWMAAICAGPTVLSRLGLIDGKTAVCYPTMSELLAPAIYNDAQPAVQDGRLLTGQGAGAAFQLGLLMLTALKNAEVAGQIAASVCWRG